MSKYKITGIIYIHTGMNGCAKFDIREFPQREREREGERERENSNSKTLFYKDCILGSVKNLFERETETDRDRDRDRQTDR